MSKIILLTGASRGIGHGILKTLSKDKANIIVATATGQAGVDKINQLIKSSDINGGGEIWNALVDGDAHRLIEQIKEKYGGAPDVLINNAGITRDNLLLRMKSHEWHDVIQANLTACFELSQACSKSMLRKRWGRIINMSSVVACIGNAGQANYAAAKAGLIGFTKSLAAEIASRNITVNCICPGFIDTEMLDFLDEEQKKKILEKIPMKRLGTAEEIAHAVKFLISDDCGYMTGTCLQINGGLVML